MPTYDRRSAISVDEARFRAGEAVFPTDGAGSALGAVGLEPELFPIFTDPSGRPAGRMLLEDQGGAIETIDQLVGPESMIRPRCGPESGPWSYGLRHGGQLTFEPGGQIEHSTAVHSTAREALADVQKVLNVLSRAFHARGATLAASGLDLWHHVSSVPQQLRAWRYTAMASYYDRRGPWGRVMMRHSASLQLNLDLGPEGVWQERWLAANLISPLMTATFACSPTDKGVCTRAMAWQGLDPTRTGFPPLLMTSSEQDPRRDYGDAAVNADLLLVRLTHESTVAGEPGWSFAGWAADGHPVYGWPTPDDLDYHLSTLFFEVRPRRFLELRAGEALPDAWRAAPVVLVTALLYDDRARRAAIDLLDPVRPRLDDLWRRAAVEGVRDPEIATLAVRLWELALDGASRLPAGYIGEENLRAARAFLHRYTMQGRMPSDEIGQLLEDDPATALAWARAGAP